MYPKPQERRSLFGHEFLEGLGAIGDLFNRFFGPLPSGWGTPLVRRTVTVLVEYNPSNVDEHTMAEQVLARLMEPERPEVEGQRCFAWRAVRSHVWDTDSTWEVKSDD